MTARAKYPVKSILRTYPNLLSEVRRQAAKFTGAKPLLVKPWTRFWIRTLLCLLGVAFAINLLLPQVGGLRQTWQVLRTVRWAWLVVGVLVLPAVFFAAAMALRGVVNRPLGLKRTALAQGPAQPQPEPQTPSDD